MIRILYRSVAFAGVTLGVGGLAAITITPASHDFGQVVVTGVMGQAFTLTSTAGDSMSVSLTGPHAVDFVISGGPQTLSCTDEGGVPVTSCDIDITFRPSALGVRTATLVVTNRRGQRATAALRGEGVKAGCQPMLVMCNYVNLYSGSIQIRSVDTVTTTDHTVRNEEEINISVVNGVVTCSGLRQEREVHGYKGKMDREMKGTGPITGSGMLAIEFQLDEGRPVYVLTYACPAPRMTRISTDLNSGNAETETFPGSSADWRDSQRLADPQPSTGIGMTPLKGNHTDTRYEPENSTGGITKSMWELKRL